MFGKLFGKRNFLLFTLVGKNTFVIIFFITTSFNNYSRLASYKVITICQNWDARLACTAIAYWLIQLTGSAKMVSALGFAQNMKLARK